MPRQKQWFYCSYGVDKIKTFIGTKRDIIRRLKKINCSLFADNLLIKDYFTEQTVLDLNEPLDKFFSQSEIKEIL